MLYLRVFMTSVKFFEELYQVLKERFSSLWRYSVYHEGSFDILTKYLESGIFLPNESKVRLFVAYKELCNYSKNLLKSANQENLINKLKI